MLAHNFLLYFEKSEPHMTPLGVFALDFCRVEKATETIRKGFREVKSNLVRAKYSCFSSPLLLTPPLSDSVHALFFVWSQQASHVRTFIR